MSAPAAAPPNGWKYFKFQTRGLRNTAAGRVSIGQIEFRSTDGKSVDVRTAHCDDMSTNPANVLQKGGDPWTDRHAGDIIIEFGDIVDISAFRLVTGPNDADMDPIKWFVEASRDRISWSVIHEQGRRFPIPRERETATRWFKVGTDLTEWKVPQWLEDVGILDFVAEKLCPQHEQEFKEPNYNGTRIKNMREADFAAVFKGDAFAKDCAQFLVEAVGALRGSEIVDEVAWSTKFAAEANVIRYAYGGLDTYFGGLEALVDLPNPAILEGMFEDHCIGPVRDTETSDVDDVWQTGNYGIRTTSMTEWGFVVHAEDGNDVALSRLRHMATPDGQKVLKRELLNIEQQFNSEKQPEPTYNETWTEFEAFAIQNNRDFAKNFDRRVTHPEWPAEGDKVGSREVARRPRPLRDFMPSWIEINKLLRSSAEDEESITDRESWLKSGRDGQHLQVAELIGARLYTGPMFEKYNGRLRYYTGNEFLMKQCMRLCKDNKYTTTLHVINSALIKMGKVLPAKKVYRGLSGGVLPKQFLEANRLNIRGGIEFGFTSTTTNRNVAVSYSQGRTAKMIFELQLGMIDKGADLAWLSQYPHEKEICLTPLTGMEVMGTSIQGDTLVVSLRLNVNMMALTIEQVVRKRFKLLRELTINTRKEIDLYMKKWGPESALLAQRGLVASKDLTKHTDANFKATLLRGKEDKEYYNIDVNLRDGLVATINQRIWVVGAKAVADVVSALKLVFVPMETHAMSPCPLLPQGETAPTDLGNEPEHEEERRYWAERAKRVHLLDKKVVKKESEMRDCDRCEDRIKQFEQYGYCGSCNVTFCTSCANEVAVKHLIGDDPIKGGNKGEEKETRTVWKPLLVDTLDEELNNLTKDHRKNALSLFKARFLSCAPEENVEDGNLRAILMYILTKPCMCRSEKEFLKEISEEQLRENTFKDGTIYPELQLIDELIKGKRLKNEDLMAADLNPAHMLKLGFAPKDVYENSRRGGTKAHREFRVGDTVVAHVFTENEEKYVADEVVEILPPHVVFKSGVKVFLTTGNNRMRNRAGQLEQWEVNVCDWRADTYRKGATAAVEESGAAVAEVDDIPAA